jgi:hypothetical protein
MRAIDVDHGEENARQHAQGEHPPAAADGVEQVAHPNDLFVARYCGNGTRSENVVR